MNNKEKWLNKLTPQQYRITREKGTEPAFSGDYYDHQEEGAYACLCCGAELFDSESKYDSGSGWPSFFRSIKSDSIKEHQDNNHGMQRTEVVCANCDAHLGHLFPDGPEPTGLRYCVNSASLSFSKKEKK
jgi:peptide-methionine (R)-S-oxide reductase